MSMKILIVEDNLDSREMLHFLLTSHGYDVKTAVDGLEGLYMTKAEKPDLIITDLAMPNCDGSEMISVIRALPEIADIHIVVYTGFDSKLAKSEIAGTANKTFSKPFDLEALIEHVNDYNLRTKV